MAGKAPARQRLLRTVTAIAARAASLYFRYGGTATMAFRGVQVARTLSSLSSFSWSGLATRSSFSNLQTLATNAGRSYVNNRFRASVWLREHVLTSASEINVRERLAQRRPSAVNPGPSVDRIDPAITGKTFEILWHRERLAALRAIGCILHGLEGYRRKRARRSKHSHRGTDRAVRLSDLDERFVTDEVAGKLFSADGNRLIGYSVK